MAVKQPLTSAMPGLPFASVAIEQVVLKSVRERKRLLRDDHACPEAVHRKKRRVLQAETVTALVLRQLLTASWSLAMNES
jgi:hypothetical protein